MFYHLSLNHDVVLHPRYFGRQLNDTVCEKLYQDVEGCCLGNLGYIISITSVTEIEKGVIDVAGGMAHFHVKYKAIVYRPFKGEVVDAIVRQINAVGIFAEVGAVSCFINRHSIPSNYKFVSGCPSVYKSDGDELAIMIEEKIRIKIIGIRIDISGMFAVATLMDDFLGIIEN